MGCPSLTARQMTGARSRAPTERSPRYNGKRCPFSSRPSSAWQLITTRLQETPANRRQRRSVLGGSPARTSGSVKHRPLVFPDQPSTQALMAETCPICRSSRTSQAVRQSISRLSNRRRALVQTPVRWFHSAWPLGGSVARTSTWLRTGGWGHGVVEPVPQTDPCRQDRDLHGNYQMMRPIVRGGTPTASRPACVSDLASAAGNAGLMYKMGKSPRLLFRTSSPSPMDYPPNTPSPL